MLKKFTVPLLALISCATVQAQQLEFKGVPFGTTREAFKAALPDFSCYGTCLSVKPGEYRSYGGNWNSEIEAGFTDGKLSWVQVGFRAESFENIVGALTGKYGPATSVEVRVFRTVGGIEVPNEERAWAFPDGGLISISRHLSTLNEGSMLMTSKDGEKTLNERHAQRAARAKKDI